MRPALPGAGGAGGRRFLRSSRRFADAAGRRGTGGWTLSEVHHRRPDALAVQRFSHDELRAFDTRVRRGLGLAPAPEPARRPDLRRPSFEVDGLAVSLRYERGRLCGRRHSRRRRDGRAAPRPAHDPGDPGRLPGPRRSRRGARCSCPGGVRADQCRNTGSTCPSYANPRNSGTGYCARTPAVTAGRQLSTAAVPAGRGRAAGRQPERRPRPLAASASPSTPIGRRGSTSSRDHVHRHWREKRHDPVPTDGVVREGRPLRPAARLGMVAGRRAGRSRSSSRPNRWRRCSTTSFPTSGVTGDLRRWPTCGR